MNTDESKVRVELVVKVDWKSGPRSSTWESLWAEILRDITAGNPWSGQGNHSSGVPDANN
jgi:hypothetical protein